MKLLTTSIFIFFITTQLFSQDGWDYQIINNGNYNQFGAICAMDDNQVYVILDDGIFLKSTDGGVIWMEYNTGVSGYFFDMVFYSNDIGFAVGTNGSVIKTINGGEDWMLLSSGTSNDLFSISMPSLNTIWVVGDNGTVLNSVDQGGTWVLDNTMSDEKLNSISFRDTDTGFIAGNNGALFHTQNGGVLWEVSNITTNDDLFSISTTNNSSFLLAGYVDDYYYYAGYTGFKTNNSIDWEEFYINSPDVGPSKLYFHNDDLGFSAAAACMLCDCCILDIDKSSNSGENWEDSCYFETTAANLLTPNYLDIDFATDEIGYVLSGSLLLKTMDGGTNTVIILNIDDFIYNNNPFSIYPNPASSNNINIDFNITDTSELSINLFDINGKNLLSESDITSKTSIDISSISQGIYFVSLLKEGHVIATQKLIVD